MPEKGPLIVCKKKLAYCMLKEVRFSHASKMKKWRAKRYGKGEWYASGWS